MSGWQVSRADCRLLAAVFAMAFLALFWGGTILGISWLAEQPDEVRLRVGRYVAGCVIVFGGVAVIRFALMMRLDRPMWRSWSFLPRRGRRPAGAEVQRPEASPLPPRADVAHGPTAPPLAGGRALPRPTNGRWHLDRLHALGMGRTRRDGH